MKEEGGPRFRQLQGLSKQYGDLVLTLIPVIGIVGVLNVPSHFRIFLHLQQFIALLFGLVLGSAFILLPFKKGASLARLPWYDLFFSLLSIVAGLYIAVHYKTIMVDVGIIQTERVVLGICAVLLTIEASRRVVGLPFIVIILVFIFYALFASHFPGKLYTRAIAYDNLATYLYLDPQGVLGIPLEVAATIVLVFLLFGQTISSVGVSRLFNDLAFALMGKYRGGPAKVAVFASSLFGMISGSAVANVATIGVFTIPLMKKAGYRPYFAGAVEAVSGTGGQIMPPIMGAAAFIMATFIGVPYAKIALSALIPALLYYIAVFIQIDLRAGKGNLHGLPAQELPKVREVLRDNWPFSIPFLVLVYTLFILWMEAESAGLISILATIILGFLMRKRTGLHLKTLPVILRDAGKGLLEIGVTSAGAGLIIGVLSITGLAFTFSSVLVSLAKGSVFLLLLLSAIGASILGMGMTVTASYLLMVVLAAPALVEMGISPLLAHFFVFYYGVLSFLTPPVCLAAYAAASIAGANMTQTAFQAMRLGIAAYLVPFIFAFRPALLLEGSIAAVLEACITAAMGVSFLAIGIEGFLFRPIQIWKRIVLMIGGFLTMIPGIIFDAVGLCMVLPILFLEWRWRRKELKPLEFQAIQNRD
ncbi:MAG TPA: TRAP transporter fused permease subunit [Thermodesulfobacteriota bacterium]|nr:TRAP transporter fused permease subunit [Thermodesulfobacteriota bacterium]